MIKIEAASRLEEQSGLIDTVGNVIHKTRHFLGARKAFGLKGSIGHSKILHRLNNVTDNESLIKNAPKNLGAVHKKMQKELQRKGFVIHKATMHKSGRQASITVSHPDNPGQKYRIFVNVHHNGDVTTGHHFNTFKKL